LNRWFKWSRDLNYSADFDISHLMRLPFL
jgi:hypothetical protein